MGLRGEKTSDGVAHRAWDYILRREVQSANNGNLQALRRIGDHVLYGYGGRAAGDNGTKAMAVKIYEAAAKHNE